MGWHGHPQARNMKAGVELGRGQRERQRRRVRSWVPGPAWASHFGAGLMLGWCRRKTQPLHYSTVLYWRVLLSEGHPPQKVVMTLKAIPSEGHSCRYQALKPCFRFYSYSAYSASVRLQMCPCVGYYCAGRLSHPYEVPKSLYLFFLYSFGMVRSHVRHSGSNLFSYNTFCSCWGI